MNEACEERFALFSFLCENLIEIGRKIYLTSKETVLSVPGNGLISPPVFLGENQEFSIFWPKIEPFSL
jgi:hypothetical protein